MLTVGGRFPFSVMVVVARPLAPGRNGWPKAGEEETRRVAARAKRPARDMVVLEEAQVEWRLKRGKSLPGAARRRRGDPCVTPWKLSGLATCLNHVSRPVPPPKGGVLTHT